MKLQNFRFGKIYIYNEPHNSDPIYVKLSGFDPKHFQFRILNTDKIITLNHKLTAMLLKLA